MKNTGWVIEISCIQIHVLSEFSPRGHTYLLDFLLYLLRHGESLSYLFDLILLSSVS